MDKFTTMARLLDIYGNVLTDKQRDVMDYYYNYDLSLQEIAENVGISKQGVHDLLKRAEDSLYRIDRKLGFYHRLTEINERLKKVYTLLNQLSNEEFYKEDSPSDDRVFLLNICRREIEELMNTYLGG
ncbi:MAG: hypothetical protein GX854_04815 [Clostridiales bacterium]|jgi:predicted DNA-binding protein YlxM (UPF0122 family)|nr:hypothetical protein [Clostridiales bacterium]